MPELYMVTNTHCFVLFCFTKVVLNYMYCPVTVSICQLMVATSPCQFTYVHFMPSNHYTVILNECIPYHVISDWWV